MWWQLKSFFDYLNDDERREDEETTDKNVDDVLSYLYEQLYPTDKLSPPSTHSDITKYHKTDRTKTSTSLQQQQQQQVSHPSSLA